MKPLLTIFTILLFVALFPCSLTAQTALGEITGEVTDPSGSPVPGVALHIIDSATGIQTSVETDGAGLFLARSLSPGLYELQAQKAGFKMYRASGIELRTGQVLRYDIKMELGPFTTTVQVQAEAGAAEVQKDSGDISSITNARTIEEYPTQSRRVIEQVAVTPGVLINNKGGADQNGMPFLSVAGNPGVRGMNYYIDGVDASRRGYDGGNLPDVNPPPEDVQEMRVITNNYSAEFGGDASAAIMMATKSGTNSFRGSLYEYLQNNALDTRNFFSQEVPPTRYNDYGGTLGGPIVKNKTFFFVNIDNERSIESTTGIITVPTAQQRTGDFSQTFNATGQLIPIYDPATTCGTNGNPACAVDANGNPIITRQPFPGNIIPQSRIDPVAAKVVQYYPLPNLPGLITGGNNYRSTYTSSDSNFFTYFTRLDHQLTPRDILYLRINGYVQTQSFLGPFGKDNVADPGEEHENVSLHPFAAAWTRTISPTTLSEFRFGRQNWWGHVVGSNPGALNQNYAAKLGLQNLDSLTFPDFSLAGYSNLGGGTFAQDLLWQALRNYTMQETISHIRGKHSFRIGGEARATRQVFNWREYPSGDFTFNNLATAQGPSFPGGNSMASFLLGQVYTAAHVENPAPDYRYWSFAGFLQDDWRVRPNLTLNLGARYEYDTHKHDVTNSTNLFSFTQINPVCNCPGVIEFSQDIWRTTDHEVNLYNTTPHDVGPRFGFAWEPRTAGSFVVRGGYGIFYVDPEYGDMSWGPPQAGVAINQNLSSPDSGVTPAFLLSQGFPTIPAQPLTDSFGAVTPGSTPIYNPEFYWQDRHAGYMEQFNLGVQKRLGKMLLEVTYMGNLGRNIPYPGGSLNYNEVKPENRGPGNGQLLRPFPQFGDVLGYGQGFGISNYHAALVQLRREFANGLSFQTNYVLARQLDDLSYRRSDWNKLADYGPGAQAVNHRFVWSSVYDLPWGPGKRLLRSGPAASILGGWSTGVFVTLQSGGYANISNITNTCNCFTDGTQGVNLIGDPAKSHSSFNPATETWFNTSVFASPAPYTFGDAGPGLFKNPALHQVNATLMKQFRFRERWALTLRAEAFNLFNHPNLSPPDTTFGDPAFGTITSAATGRLMQLGVKVSF